MPFSDWPLAQLRAYRPEIAVPEDFDDFWSSTLAESRAAGGEATLHPAQTPVTQLIVDDLTFPGFAGEPIRGWVTRPRDAAGPLPTVVEFVGYGGGRGLPHERLQWAASGYVHILMDTRGQGGGWGTGGNTPDPHGSGPATPGFMTRGVHDPHEYYYRRVFTDAVRLIDAARGFDFVDESRISVVGASQGGGIALAVAGLVPDLAGVMPDVPFLCDFRRSAQATPLAPFTELRTYLATNRSKVDDTFRTLSYFDGVTFAARASAPALFSVALMDDVVLPSTVFAAFNNYGGDSEIEVYEFNGHEGGQTFHWQRQAAWLADRLG
ncbi:acetylxylan esterase [soil metagenome]